MGRRCQQCQRIASFNLEGTNTPKYCKQHAEDGMVNVRKRFCAHDSCTKSPSLNVVGSRGRTARIMPRTIWCNPAALFA
ncbi:unnamed protein product [Laminaria digitata]